MIEKAFFFYGDRVLALFQEFAIFVPAEGKNACSNSHIDLNHFSIFDTPENAKLDATDAKYLKVYVC